MLRNYFKTAWRNLMRNKAFSVINVLGLSLGLACSILVVLWIRDEYSVDAFHQHDKQLYQVYERWYHNGKVDASYSTQGLLARELKRVIPEITYASSFDYASMPGTKSTFEEGTKIYKMAGKFAGADFFSMFSYPLLQGSPESVLNMPGAVAISRKMADLFFGSPAGAIGRTIRYENKEDLRVTAVFEDLPANASRQFDFVRSWTDYVKQNNWVYSWGNSSPETFIELRQNADPRKVEAAIKDFLYRYEPREKDNHTELALQPYQEKYLHGNFKNGQIDGGRIEYVHLFTWVALFILLIACINFMNLSTARSAKRAREVGLRKVMGASRFSLISRFIGEAMLLTLFSVIIAIVGAALLLPPFNSLTGKQLSLPFNEPLFWMALAGLTLLTGIVAGSYPALLLSSLRPVRVLKGDVTFGRASISLRKVLVVFQFTLSIILVIAMIVIYRQVDYIQTVNLGYDRDHLLYIPIEGNLDSKYELFKEQAEDVPGVMAVSKMRNTPTVIDHHTGIRWPGKDPHQHKSFADAVVGYDFVKTMKLHLVSGRDFSRKFGSDSASFLLNETAVKRIGNKDPIGQVMIWGDLRGKVIGVVKDFHFNSLHDPIDPLIIRLDEHWNWGTILVRLRATETRSAIAGLEKICQTLNPEFPFTYRFSDAAYGKLYNSERVVSKLSAYFAFWAIFISCLGLFGLVAYAAEQRTREIGIRKVLGASVAHIVRDLAMDFLKLVMLAILIASPLAWLGMDKWLEGYAYRINISGWIFLVAGALALLIALVTVSLQAIRAAMANPVRSLRSE
ncbi:MAG TPA: ABC transporter permease [Chitinophagaceae bacterium]|nr:ABC transporter permease [Chitinophagaceae bacterium]